MRWIAIMFFLGTLMTVPVLAGDELESEKTAGGWAEIKDGVCDASPELFPLCSVLASASNGRMVSCSEWRRQCADFCGGYPFLSVCIEIGGEFEHAYCECLIF